MIAEIIKKIKTGKIKNVVPFGVEHLPAPPYVVVAEMDDPLGRGVVYRITTHVQPGQNLILSDYVREDLDQLLSNVFFLNRFGNKNYLRDDRKFFGIVTNNDDKTISKERRFLMPEMIF